MDQLIPIINKLQDVFNAIGYDPIDLPQIVVIGSQSSGKSSVLENIVCKDFLPRGKDIVTRRPLVLQLVHEPHTVEDWAEFLHHPEEKYKDFTKVREEIEADTDRIAGPNKDISKLPIHLRIHSSRVLNLTLVDLPGLTKIPIEDQPADIEQQIRNLIYEYISRPNSIILAVSPANVDLVNSEALKLAREVDPEGSRTIGVLTKIDLMDAGTNALEILQNKSHYKLKLGFIGVINRSQQDIINSKSIGEALKYEADFFRSHPIYRAISNNCGAPFLGRTLNSILLYHIRDHLPELRAKINNLIASTQAELISWGESSFQGAAHRGTVLLRLITKFANDFADSIDGNARSLVTSELCGGARINHIFNEVYPAALQQIDATGKLTLGEVKMAIRNSTGPRPSLFVPEVSFDLLVKKQIQKLEIPAMRVIEMVFDELIKVVNRCDRKELSRFPKLNQKILDVATEAVRERLAPSSEMIEHLINIELAYINTNHPDFLRAGAAISALGKMFDKRRKKETFATERERRPSNVSAFSLSPATEEDRPSIPTTVPSNLQSKNDSHNNGSIFQYLFKGPAVTPHPTTIAKDQHPRKVPLSSPVRAMAPKKPELDDDFLDHTLSTMDISDSASTDRRSPAEHDITFTSEKEEIETHLILSLIQSYYSVVRKNLQDSVPKAIMFFLVNNVKENLQNRLVAELYKEELFNDLLQEDENVAKERAKCKSMLDAYKKAASVLSDIRDTSSFK